MIANTGRKRFLIGILMVGVKVFRMGSNSAEDEWRTKVGC